MRALYTVWSCGEAARVDALPVRGPPSSATLTLGITLRAALAPPTPPASPAAQPQPTSPPPPAAASRRPPLPHRPRSRPWLRRLRRQQDHQATRGPGLTPVVLKDTHVGVRIRRALLPKARPVAVRPSRGLGRAGGLALALTRVTPEAPGRGASSPRRAAAVEEKAQTAACRRAVGCYRWRACLDGRRRRHR